MPANSNTLWRNGTWQGRPARIQVIPLEKNLKIQIDEPNGRMNPEDFLDDGT
jgi:hypothetical protein